MFSPTASQPCVCFWSTPVGNEYPEGGVEPTLHFALLDDCLVVRNNERGFQPAHVRAICDVGSSTKDRLGMARDFGPDCVGVADLLFIFDFLILFYFVRLHLAWS